MTDFWTGFAVGWAVGAIVASLAPRFFYWQTRRYYTLRDRYRDRNDGNGRTPNHG
jgi:hypothetical protein